MNASTRLALIACIAATAYEARAQQPCTATAKVTVTKTAKASQPAAAPVYGPGFPEDYVPDPRPTRPAYRAPRPKPRPRPVYAGPCRSNEACLGSYAALLKRSRSVDSCQFEADMLVSQMRFDPLDLVGLYEAEALDNCLTVSQKLERIDNILSE